ncbi:GNAT family N-acetyltransferase [Pseudosporangium ferrugineum]|nr:GNAT family N-acetyltransferase [Pseudosporangium ferrugineum]
MRIRAARAGDLEAIRGIEARAGTLFYDVGMPDIARHPVPAASVLARFVRAGRSWVVVEGSARPSFALPGTAAGLRAAGPGAAGLGAADPGAADPGATGLREAGPEAAGPGAAGPEAELAGGMPVAYVLVEVVDGLAHIEQVSVDPPYARRGIGRRLIDHVGRWAGERGMSGMTLTTFRGVPWKAPYYARLGFVELAEGERGPELARLMAVEARHGLDPVERIAMRREVAPPD